MAKKNVAESPLERSSLASLDQKIALAKRCSHGIFLFFFVIIIIIFLLINFSKSSRILDY